MTPTEQPLTERQAQFCELYARTLNGAQAYAAAYSPDQRLGSTVCGERARRLLRASHILCRIADLRSESREDWCARAKPRTRFVKPSCGQHTSPPENVDTLEYLALVAFDPKQSDLSRLAALRCIDNRLAALGAAAFGGPPVRVLISLGDEPRRA